MISPLAPVIVLASASPRRQTLLRRLFPDFTVDPADLDEDALTQPNPVATAEALALAKARWVATRHPEAVVIGGDTVVALGRESGSRQLTKPRDIEDARAILRTLSGRSHVVITGMALVGRGKEHTFHEISTVTFRPLSDAEIDAYVATGEPMDKAGAYASQGGAAAFIERLEGDLDNVIGLPVARLATEWRAWCERIRPETR